jgi:hypothetical protein
MAGTPDIAAALSDRYVIEKPIGAGGMAVVYLAHDVKLDREVALKVLRPELGAVLGSERFLAEIKIAARLDHPHILTLIDSGTADGLVYYVLPYVRGESLRARITRERQLGLDDALSITKQVASALDYAHRKGLVHRDIKPENILFQEGEAMLTDFGIALAVTEAGGGRLTETGLSLGTPQYMSPEQATGDRGIDGRSDIYSLAAVLYEMLAGDPPFTGSTAQAMIAKLITERPTPLHVLRESVPPNVEAAVAKALSKTPADRFATAGDFVKALEAPPAVVQPPAASPRRRTGLVVGAAATVAVIAAVAAVAARRHTAAPALATGAILGSRTQLTLRGDVLFPAISPDGKQLAYVTQHCGAGGCKYSVLVQDVGSTTTRSVFEGATGAFNVEWSPDRRNLILDGAINRRAGSFLLSALGGTPRFLTPGAATFFAGGDSLLIGPPLHQDSVWWIRAAGLDGAVRDSIRLVGKGQGVAALSSVAGTNWIVAAIYQQPHGFWQVIDRSGTVADHVVNDCTCGGLATYDAIWLSRAGHGDGETIVRLGFDRATGKLSARQDTMFTGLFTNFTLTADGAGLVMDEGTYDYGVWSLDASALLTGKYPDGHRIARASSPVDASVSPDGARLLLRRRVPTGGGHAETRFSLMPFAGGTESPIGIAGSPTGASWIDSVTLAVQFPRPGGLHLVEVDVRTGAQRNALDLSDSSIYSPVALSDGWAWVTAGGDRIVSREGGRTRVINKPPSASYIQELRQNAIANRFFYASIDKATGDTVTLGVVDLAAGTLTPWVSTYALGGYLYPLADGTAYVGIAEALQTYTFYRLTGPGAMKRLGSSPRPLLGFSVSGDGKRATARERDYRADAWMSKVIKQ